MIEGIRYDDGDQPAVGLVPPGASWDEVRDHIKIAHGPLLVGPDESGQFAGAYWASSQMVVAGELGTDQEEAVAEFRELLSDLGWL